MKYKKYNKKHEYKRVLINATIIFQHAIMTNKKV